jgi:hypothetical protein
MPLRERIEQAKAVGLVQVEGQIVALNKQHLVSPLAFDASPTQAVGSARKFRGQGFTLICNLSLPVKLSG